MQVIHKIVHGAVLELRIQRLSGSPGGLWFMPPCSPRQVGELPLLQGNSCVCEADGSAPSFRWDLMIRAGERAAGEHGEGQKDTD